MSGRHAAESKGTFYRDLFTLIGLLGLGFALGYLGLSALAGSTPPDETSTTAITVASTSTTTTAASTTTDPAGETTSTSTTTETTQAIRPPGEVRVLVLNSIGITGLAGQVTAHLADLGYDMLPPDNYTPALDQSRVWYLPGFEAEAFALAAEFPDALIEQNPDLAVDADIVVVLGESYEA